MLHGPLNRQIFFFAIPIALTQILEQLFNAADLAVMGRFVGTNAMAAVGANTPVVGLLVTLFFGISIGANAVISQLIGQGRNKDVGQMAVTSIWMALISGVAVAIIGELLANWIFRIMSVPAAVLPMAVLYLRVYLIGMPVILLYNFESAIFRAMGNTKTPLICLTIAGTVNIALNLFFVLVVRMTVDGVATATVISNFISSVLLFILLMRNPHLKLKENFKHGMDKNAVGRILWIGLPAGLQNVVFSLSNMFIQSAINSLGANVMAASSAAYNIEIFAYFIISCFGQASTTFTGQNYGAGDMKRCKKVCRTCIIEDEISTIVIAAILLLAGHPLLRIFNTDPAVISLGYTRLIYILVPGVVNVFIEVLSGTMRGYGNSLAPALISLIGICGIRVGWAYSVFRVYHTFASLLMAYPAAWVVTAIAMAIAYFRVMKKLSRKPAGQQV